tara:strand:- start:159 stop:608 length:450 start_codon:yes stop_codon:yes gene_type:complete
MTIIKTGIEDVAGSAMEKGIQIRVNSPVDRLPLFCDQEQLNQVMRNLLGNALKFSPHDSEVDVSINLNEDKVSIAISDHGVGIPEEELEQVFSKFVQSSKTNSGAGGTGLGLAICKEFILLHKGYICAQNNKNGGATVLIELPLEKQNS